MNTIKEIYEFCNWTTSHVDIDENQFLGMLTEHIQKFIKVHDSITSNKKLNNPK